MHSTIDARLARIIDRVPEWRNRHVDISPLPGGLTNSNYRLDVDGQSYVVRIPGESTELLAIDRAAEHENTRRAAQRDLGPRIVHHFPDEHVMVLEFLDGTTLTKDQLQLPRMPSRVAAVVRQLHRGGPFSREFHMIAVGECYRETIRDRGFEVPAGFEARREDYDRVCAALAARPLPAVACHNDLLAENFIDCGGQLRIVDFEYSGQNDPCFELGNFCQEQEYDDARIAEACDAYFGQASAEALARIKLNMIVSDTVWAMWAMIQHRISKVEFDYWIYGCNRWRRAEAKLDSRELAGWLADAIREVPAR